MKINAKIQGLLEGQDGRISADFRNICITKLLIYKVTGAASVATRRVSSSLFNLKVAHPPRQRFNIDFKVYIVYRSANNNLVSGKNALDIFHNLPELLPASVNMFVLFSLVFLVVRSFKCWCRLDIL